MNRLAVQGMNQQYIEKKEKEICEQGARFHANQDISMFSLSIILTFKNHQSTKDPFPFKTIIELKNLRNV